MHRVVGVDAHAAVDVRGAMHDALSAVGGPPLGDQHRRCRDPIPREQPGGLPQCHPHRLEVDVAVGELMVDGLEGRQRTAELLAAVEVRDGLRDCTGADARSELRPSASSTRSISHGTVRAVGRTDQLAPGGTGEGDVGADLPVGGLRLLERHSVGAQIDQRAVPYRSEVVAETSARFAT